MKKIKSLSFLCLILASCTTPLPNAKPGSGIRGEQFGVDKNINEQTIDNYLYRDDVCYIDCRMLVDEANYEAIEGSKYLDELIDGFKVCPYPYVAPISGLPSEVGQGYNGNTLYSFIDGHYLPNYQESSQIISDIFPKDKAIFLMCGGGGYAYMMKNFLIDLGYNKNKIYNVGGYWFYDGNNKVKVRNEDGTFDYSKFTYYEINDFNSYTKL